MNAQEKVSKIDFGFTFFYHKLTFSSQPPNKGGRWEKASNISSSQSAISRSYDSNRAGWEGRGTSMGAVNAKEKVRKVDFVPTFFFQERPSSSSTLPRRTTTTRTG